MWCVPEPVESQERWCSRHKYSLTCLVWYVCFLEIEPQMYILVWVLFFFSPFYGLGCVWRFASWGHSILNKLTHFLTSAQQFSRLKGDETGNWTGPVNFSDDGSLKPARNGRKRYLSIVNECTTPLEKKKEKDKEFHIEHSDDPALHAWTGPPIMATCLLRCCRKQTPVAVTLN